MKRITSMVVYGDSKCSKCHRVLGTPSALDVHKFPAVVDDGDDTGMEARIFCPMCWAKVEGIYPGIIYDLFPKSEWVD